MKYILLLFLTLTACSDFWEEDAKRGKANAERFEKRCHQKIRALRPLHPVQKGIWLDQSPYQRMYKSGEMILVCVDKLGGVSLEPTFNNGNFGEEE